MTGQATGSLRIGEQIGQDGKRNGTPIDLASKDLVTHGVIVGMTGSGKTGLALALIEETLLSGVPVLMIDPKGDLGNLCLTFPNLAAADFAPWIAKGDDAEKVAATWKEGLAGWGLDGTNIQRLRDAAPVTIYTPGSRAGVPLNVIGSMAPPVGADEETRNDEIEAFVSGLLKLVGIDSDPLSSREHILLSNLITAAWEAGSTVDLAGLIAQIQQPPMRKLGVIELDTFFPPKDRADFALRINGLLASPSFAAWLEGEALDIQRLLFGADGAPRAAIISIAHCSDDERMFLVTLILSKVVAWMRAQQGTTDLRALVYMDEVFGYVPPTAVPPSKKPILTILKQARAFGVGLVVATQNPVDVDYKALSNAGTWLIGRLQTEQDKARLMD
ncbi:MAG: helicase HerA-like domain-containing protein, partial [Acidimicrobiia bacterium]